MRDAFDTDVAERMPRTKPRRPWDIKPTESLDRETVDKLSRDKKTIDKSSMDKKTIDRKSIARPARPDTPSFDYINDHILPALEPKSQLIYIRLHRLSYGSQRDTTDFIGYTALARQCRISPKSAYRAIKDLLHRKLIFIVEHHKAKGTKYRLVLSSMDSESIDK